MATELEIVDDLGATTPSNRGFLKVRRLRLRAHYDDGRVTDPFPYDVVDRAALDAVCMVLWTDNPDAPHDPLVLVRTALRPPLLLRRARPMVVPDPRTELLLWELPAGLIEPDERGEAGVMDCAARETEEETGFALTPDAFRRLSVPVYLSPGLCAEKIHFVTAHIPDRGRVGVATTSEVLEHSSECVWWPLSLCLQRCAEGVIEDAKTELGLLRFAAARAAGR